MSKKPTNHPVIKEYLTVLKSDEELCFLLDHDEEALSEGKNVLDDGAVESPDGDRELNELFLHASQPEAQLVLGRIAHLRARAFRISNFDLW